MAGQQLFYPPNVSGWNDDRWLDTSTFRAPLADRAARARRSTPFNPTTSRPRDRPPADPVKLVDKALGWWGGAASRRQTRRRLLAYAEKTWPPRSPTTTGSGRSRHDLQRPAPPRRRVPEMQTA